MTKDEIIALIDAKIAGQGTNIDAGSVLPKILKGLADLIPAKDQIPVVTINGKLVSGFIEITNEQEEALFWTPILQFNGLFYPVMSSLTQAQKEHLNRYLESAQGTEVERVFGYCTWEDNGISTGTLFILSNVSGTGEPILVNVEI